ncbi:TolC family protein [Paraliomyxa miuraensis]|uniref:TolC family protein n=1 Tax=Paraliomyxa miuraensis TaxID=376150 RepID=UPI00224F6264|nr:TolC family protein [Paraliomyxa miuraensis]MCX4246433.1 TolC family protein [Paraliomyxa miuraensis]
MSTTKTKAIARSSMALALGLLTACATTSPAGPRGEASELLAQRAGVEDAISPEQDEQSRTRVRQRVRALLAEPLSAERAVQVAMLNNRELQATLEELGVAQAELVEAGLLENPVIAGDLVFSTRGNGLGGGLSLSQSLLSVFLIPAKRRVAKARLQHAIVTVAHEALVLVRDVKVAHAEVWAAAATVQLHRTRVQAAEVADELAAKQLEAGNLPPLDRAFHGAALDEARLELAEAEVELVAAREALSRLLGLWGSDVAWTVADAPVELPPAEPEPSALEARAVSERLDLSAARFEVEAMERAVQLRRRGVIPQLEAGVESRNEVGDDEGHEWVLGPSLAVELPIFDPGHADLARLRAELRRAQHLLQHRAIVVRSEVREHRAALAMARRSVSYMHEQALPRQAQIGDLALQQYNAMLIGTYELLQLRAEALAVQEDAVEALRDYWVTRAQLELALGGEL